MHTSSLFWLDCRKHRYLFFIYCFAVNRSWKGLKWQEIINVSTNEAKRNILVNNNLPKKKNPRNWKVNIARPLPTSSDVNLHRGFGSESSQSDSVIGFIPAGFTIHYVVHNSYCSLKAQKKTIINYMVAKKKLKKKCALHFDLFSGIWLPALVPLELVCRTQDANFAKKSAEQNLVAWSLAAGTTHIDDGLQISSWGVLAETNM